MPSSLRVLQVTLPSTLVFDYPTINGISALVASLLLQQQPQQRWTQQDAVGAAGVAREPNYEEGDWTVKSVDGDFDDAASWDTHVEFEAINDRNAVAIDNTQYLMGRGTLALATDAASRLIGMVVAVVAAAQAVPGGGGGSIWAPGMPFRDAVSVVPEHRYRHRRTVQGTHRHRNQTS